ncbi:hypothetical protein C2E23DRAFT_24942 [Lenzites betulinus]|nr:hypothetical protein C2E23DRAFT_24942 [Lenzites betulinus]
MLSRIQSRASSAPIDVDAPPPGLVAPSLPSKPCGSPREWLHIAPRRAHLTHVLSSSPLPVPRSHDRRTQRTRRTAFHALATPLRILEKPARAAGNGQGAMRRAGRGKEPTQRRKLVRRDARCRAGRPATRSLGRWEHTYHIRM